MDYHLFWLSAAVLRVTVPVVVAEQILEHLPSLLLVLRGAHEHRPVGWVDIGGVGWGG